MTAPIREALTRDIVYRTQNGFAAGSGMSNSAKVGL